MKRVLASVAILSILASPTVVRTQQQQSAPQAPSPAYSQPLSVDTQGIKNYLLGPGDVIDVRVLFQSVFEPPKGRAVRLQRSAVRLSNLPAC